MNDLLFGVSVEEIERITGESQKVIKGWKKGTKPIPEPALRLLKLYLSGDASALLGDEWKGYRFTNGLVKWYRKTGQVVKLCYGQSEDHNHEQETHTIFQ